MTMIIAFLVSSILYKYTFRCIVLFTIIIQSLGINLMLVHKIFWRLIDIIDKYFYGLMYSVEPNGAIEYDNSKNLDV